MVSALLGYINPSSIIPARQLMQQDQIYEEGNEEGQKVITRIIAYKSRLVMYIDTVQCNIIDYFKA